MFSGEKRRVEEIFADLEQVLGSASADGPEAGIAAMVRVVPVERLSSILVISPREHYHQKGGQLDRLAG